jgi:hypothetical protein
MAMYGQRVVAGPWQHPIRGCCHACSARALQQAGCYTVQALGRVQAGGVTGLLYGSDAVCGVLDVVVGGCAVAAQCQLA